jgi:hypothetical protein
MRIYSPIYLGGYLYKFLALLRGIALKLCLKVFPFTFVIVDNFHLKKKKSLTSISVYGFLFSSKSSSASSQTAALKLLHTIETKFSHARSSISEFSCYSIRSRDRTHYSPTLRAKRQLQNKSRIQS